MHEGPDLAAPSLLGNNSAVNMNGDRYCVPKLQSLSIRNSLIIISSEIHY